MIWFTADTHFGHKGIIDHCSRPFSSVEEMDESILSTINKLVQPNDTLIHLGDFCWLEKNLPTYFGSINCLNKHLVIGNHDDKSAKKYFDSVKDIWYFRHNNRKIALCHYPFHSWRRGWFHLHGHCHGTAPVKPGRIDIGWDVWKRPVSFDEIIETFDSQPPMEKY